MLIYFADQAGEIYDELTKIYKHYLKTDDVLKKRKQPLVYRRVRNSGRYSDVPALHPLWPALVIYR